jgi:rhodanese-related sulfurtransferase
MKNRIITILAIVAILLLFLGCSQTPANSSDSDEIVEDISEEVAEEPKDDIAIVGRMTDIGYYDVTPEEAKMLIDTIPELVVVDVSPKYDEGHLPGAINYYVGDGSLDAAIPNLDMSKPYLVYCHVDSASIAGARILIEAGFSPVYRLEGNYAAWVEAGYSTVK